MIRRLFLLGLVALTLGALPALAQDDDAVATGLNGPRHLFYADDGTLYISEAGKGGDEAAEGPYGEAKAGFTGQITSVSAEGEQAVVIPELWSLDAGFGQIEGPTSVYVTEEGVWATLGIGPKDPGDKPVEALVEFDPATGEVIQSIDFRAWEAENNPDESPELVSNPSDIDVDADGKVYIADASGNSVLTWTEADGLQLFAAWPATDTDPSAVPTSVSVGPDGDIYVGFLTGFPFPTGGSRIERYSPDGTLNTTYVGLTLVTDVLVTDDGTIYAVQFADGFGDEGYNAGSGSVVVVTEDGLQSVVGSLNFPYGIAESPDGELVVSVDSYNAAPDSGRVISIGSM